MRAIRPLLVLLALVVATRPAVDALCEARCQPPASRPAGALLRAAAGAEAACASHHTTGTDDRRTRVPSESCEHQDEDTDVVKAAPKPPRTTPRAVGAPVSGPALAALASPPIVTSAIALPTTHQPSPPVRSSSVLRI